MLQQISADYFYVSLKTKKQQTGLGFRLLKLKDIDYIHRLKFL